MNPNVYKIVHVFMSSTGDPVFPSEMYKKRQSSSLLVLFRATVYSSVCKRLGLQSQGEEYTCKQEGWMLSDSVMSKSIHLIHFESEQVCFGFD